MATHFKEKYQITGKRSEIIQILMVLLKIKSILKVQQEFHASNHMVWTARKLLT
jgi:hypothetical protein